MVRVISLIKVDAEDVSEKWCDVSPEWAPDTFADRRSRGKDNQSERVSGCRGDGIRTLL
jgi:hypothetical protein